MKIVYNNLGNIVAIRWEIFFMCIRGKIIEVIYRSAVSKGKAKIILSPLGGLIFFSLILFFISVSIKADAFLGLCGFIPHPVNIIVSVPVLFLGLFLVLWSNFYFMKAKGTPVPINPPSKLIIGGPYAYVRNPMVAGVFILLLGAGILLDSIFLVFIFLPFFITLMFLELKFIEEPELEKRLGNEYIKYKKRTPMFFPKILK